MISVVVPLYNHEKYIRECLGSVLGQTFGDFELLVIDDGSSDGSGQVVRSIADPRISYLRQENQGAHAAINRGVQLARGAYVSILNSDDAYHPDRLRECLGLLEADGALAAAFSHLELIDGEGKSLGVVRGAEECWTEHDPESSFMGEGDLLLDLLAGNFLRTTSNLFCRREVFAEIGPFENLRYAHDYDFFLRLCLRRRVRVIERPLLRYRVHARNTLKEDEAAARFEVGLVLARFLLDGGLERALGARPRDYRTMTRFFNSLNTKLSDRMLLTLFLFGRSDPASKEAFLGDLAAHRDNPFRRRCLESLRHQLEVWGEHQSALRVLADAERRIAELEENLTAVTGSRSYALGKALTWPLRRILGRP